MSRRRRSIRILPNVAPLTLEEALRQADAMIQRRPCYQKNKRPSLTSDNHENLPGAADLEQLDSNTQE